MSKMMTFSNPSSKMKPIIIGTAVKTPIWTKNWAFKAASRAVLPNNLASWEIPRSSPDRAWRIWQHLKLSQTLHNENTSKWSHHVNQNEMLGKYAMGIPDKPSHTRRCKQSELSSASIIIVRRNIYFSLENHSLKHKEMKHIPWCKHNIQLL